MDAERDQSRSRARPKNAVHKPHFSLGTHIAGAPYRHAVECCVVRTWGAMCNGTSGLQARVRGLPCCRGDLLRNREMRSYRPHTDFETKTVTIDEPGCKDTMIMHMDPIYCRVLITDFQIICAWRALFAGKKTRGPPHPDRSGGWSCSTGAWRQDYSHGCVARPKS